MKARGEFLDEAQKSFSVVDLDIRRARELPIALVRYLRRRRPHRLAGRDVAADCDPPRSPPACPDIVARCW